MDYILPQDVMDYAKKCELYGLSEKLLGRIQRKDYQTALSVCSDAKMRCFEAGRGTTGAEKEKHDSRMTQITELEGMVERLSRQ